MEKVISGMKEVKVKCPELLKEVESNKIQHIIEYEEAIGGYKDALLDALKDRLKLAEKLLKQVTEAIQQAEAGDLEAGTKLEPRVAEPQSHEKEYNRAIKMIEMSVDREMVLDQREFEKYVMDEWDWKEHFADMTAMYTNNKKAF